ncbi:TonB-dependent receptor [uncultured Arcticibacterium sp.]|uniref:TonB-dependent receptor n=1 Tax=uncultured Arcticibacterium sp. TaxID=2173042 RepID=UPI0030FB5AB8
MKYILLFTVLVCNTSAFGQQINGSVLENSQQPLVGAVVKWLSEPINATLTDENGEFSMPKTTGQHQLIISYLGYKTDTVMADGEGPFTFYLTQDNNDLNEVVVKSSSTVIDRISPIQTQIITTKELEKSACCNLSESFETNATVSVSFSDAITGARQLQMLGLSGKFIQTNIENMPGVRGLTIPFGLNYIPGTWVQSIDVIKGTSSLVNGYESMSGTINVELQKPDLAEPVYLNLYTNELGRGEVNLNLAKSLGEKWSVGLLSHGSFLKNEVDRNNDGFKDLPTYDQFNLLNRWKYQGEQFVGQFGVNYLKENREGGQMNDGRFANPYLFENESEKLTMFAKLAKLFPDAPFRGLGLIMNASFYDSESTFGLNPYIAKENSFYSNLIYQDILGNTNHAYKTGFSFLADEYDESYANFNNPMELSRQELVPGAFFEYTYNKLEKTILVAGIRVDQHNLFGTQVTPRLHFKQDFGDNSTWRLSVGKGFRAPTPLAENFGKLVSNRVVTFDDPIAPEISWNYGTSWTKDFGRNSFTVDVYHTEFSQHLMMDMEEVGQLLFYNTTNRSFSTSAQAEVNIIPNDRWELKAAYRWLSVKQTFLGGSDGKSLREKMFVPKSLALINVAYALPYNKWKADATLTYKGKQRIPDIELDKYSDGFVTLNSQVTRNFVRWEYYLGAENILNYKQDNPIISAGNPDDATFDAGQIWGPVVGRTVYVGVRYKLK